MAPATPVIAVEHLHKTYGTVVAVRDLSFTVAAGEVFGLVGRNGAGKTTTIEILEGLRRPEAGTVRVLGLDPAADGAALRRRIGVQLQEAALHDRLKVWEALDLFAAFYPRAADGEALLRRFELEERRNTPFAKLSGGQKQRLFAALALVGDPEIVFLDELTAGLDPHGRRAVWELVRELAVRGRTVFLTTHVMEDAERLCDRVAILDRGALVALDSPAGLVAAFAPRVPGAAGATLEDVFLALTGTAADA